jgi:hypothetical protein
MTLNVLIEGHIMAGHLDRLVKVDTNNNIRKSHRATLLLESVKLSFSKDGQKLILLDNQVVSLFNQYSHRRERWKFSSGICRAADCGLHDAVPLERSKVGDKI